MNNLDPAIQQAVENLEKELDRLFDDLKNRIYGVTKRHWMNPLSQWSKNQYYSKVPEAYRPSLQSYREINNIVHELTESLNEAPLLPGEPDSAYIDQLLDSYKDRMKSAVRNSFNMPAFWNATLQKTGGKIPANPGGPGSEFLPPDPGEAGPDPDDYKPWGPAKTPRQLKINSIVNSLQRKLNRIGNKRDSELMGVNSVADLVNLFRKKARSEPADPASPPAQTVAPAAGPESNTAPPPAEPQQNQPSSPPPQAAAQTPPQSSPPTPAASTPAPEPKKAKMSKDDEMFYKLGLAIKLSNSTEPEKIKAYLAGIEKHGLHAHDNHMATKDALIAIAKKWLAAQEAKGDSDPNDLSKPIGTGPTALGAGLPDITDDDSQDNISEKLKDLDIDKLIDIMKKKLPNTLEGLEMEDHWAKFFENWKKMKQKSMKSGGKPVLGEKMEKKRQELIAQMAYLLSHKVECKVQGFVRLLREKALKS